MLDVIKVIVLGIVEGITEWLPVSSTGHLILVGDLLQPGMSDEFMEMFNVVIQLGAIMAVVVLYFHKLNPFSPRKSKKQKMLTWQRWIKVLIASIPAAVVGLIFNDYLDAIFYKPVPVAIMLIVYGILFIVIENRNKGVTPEGDQDITAHSSDAAYDWNFPDACVNPGNFTVRRYDCGSIDYWCVSRDGGGVHFLPGNSGDVWGKLFKAGKLRFSFYRGRIRLPDAGMCSFLCSIHYCN